MNSLVKAGVITHKEAETHGKKNMITRAVALLEGVHNPVGVKVGPTTTPAELEQGGRRQRQPHSSPTAPMNAS